MATFGSALAAPPLQPVYTIPSQRSVIPVPIPTIPPDTPAVAPFEFVYQAPRAYEFADFDHDGRLDIFVAPAFGQHLPYLPVEIWLNQRDGTFANGTATVIEGAVPETWNVQDVLFGDFNEDGVDDVFLSATGGEHAVRDGHAVQGSHSTLLLSTPAGKFVDASANITPNVDTLNHMAALGDWNGDGHLDAALNAFETQAYPRTGIRLLAGDGAGNLAETIAGLPEAIAWMRFADRTTFGTDYQSTGCVGLADLDGDGDDELMTGSYTYGDLILGLNQRTTRTVRFHRREANGDFVEQSRVAIPAAIANVGVTAETIDEEPDKLGLGCAQLVAAELTGDARIDVVVLWEGNAKWYIEVLRNDGGFVFTDITPTAIGRYNLAFDGGGFQSGPGHFKLRDVNGDGSIDIFNQISPSQLPSLPGNIALLNDGSGHFTPFVPAGEAGPFSASDYLPTTQCASCLYAPLLFDGTGRGIASLVLLEFQTSVTTTSPVMTTAVHLTTLEPIGLQLLRDGFE